MAKRIRTGLYAESRLEIGAAVLAAAEVVHSSVVKQRVAPFADANEGYEAAHTAVQTAQAQLQACQDELTDLDGKQDTALEELACALVGERRSRRNPFDEFGFVAPSHLKTLKYGEKAQAIHQLAGAIQKVAARESASYRAAAAADKTARSMETALQSVHTLQATVATARHAREAAGKRWDAELAAFKCAARAAAPDGTLSRALFDYRLTKPKPAEIPKPAPVIDTPAVAPPAVIDTPAGTPAAGPAATGTPAAQPA